MKYYDAKLIDTKDAKGGRRFRNILANSGQLMESGEKRDLQSLYVMGYDGKLFRIGDLDTDPDKQTEKYAVKAQADHGNTEVITENGEPVGEALVPSIEKQFGSCKVWLEKDGLHARMYFADNDELADHAWAISEDASYSTGIDWFPEGYAGAGYEIRHEIGILREVSMVLTGNDPRAKTIDHLKVDSKAQRSEETNNGNKFNKGEISMKKEIDALTPDERDAMGQELLGVIDKFTAGTSENETELTADTEGEAETKKETEGEEKTEEKKDTLHMPVVVIKDHAAKQEVTYSGTKDWVRSKAGHQAFADTLKSVGHFGGAFDVAWRQVASRHMSLDGITGLPSPVPTEQIFVDTLEKSDGIINHLTNINTKALRVNTLYPNDDESGRAKGHTKGEEKDSQELTALTRTVLPRMIYKKLDLDASELYFNPELIDYRAQELVQAYIYEIERGVVIGDGRDSDSNSRIFDGTNGIQPIATDTVAAADEIGSYLAGAVDAGDNLYDSVVNAKAAIKTEGRQFLVAKSSVITEARTAKLSNGTYLLQPGGSIENLLDVSAVFTPAWMDEASADAYLIVDGAYALIGEANPTNRADFDTTTNVDVLLLEGMKGGSLTKYKSAIAISTASSDTNTTTTTNIDE